MKTRKHLLVISLILIASILAICTGCGESGAVAYDKDNKPIDGKEDYLAYLEIVNIEAASIISEKENCTIEEAVELLNTHKYKVYTAFDRDICDAILKGYKNYAKEELDFGCAVTDLSGHLIAAYSADPSNSGINYATQKTAPYSSFKPIGVYLPALEEGKAYWSKMYKDSPVKKVEDDSGEKSDWPANSTGTYSKENVPVCDAIKTSLNTVAVKCLKEYGVNNSLDYLESKFGLTLDFEKKKSKALGEEEVLGNVALGYLQEGVSPVAMAGYYQCFANDGMYASPVTVLKICDSEGNTIYKAENELKQVVSPEAAYVMNLLLRNVVTEGGTGEDASIDGIEIGGKTGTGLNGNWFVGFTPEYSCAIWHGKNGNGNYAATMFRDIVSGFDNNPKETYPVSKTVKESAYCKESGSLLSNECKQIGKGYYLSVKLPDNCNKH